MRRALVAILGAAAVVAALAPSALAGEVEVVLSPSLDLGRVSATAAVGLLVPGTGETVTRAGALSALVRGRATSTLVGGMTTGKVLLRPSRQPGTRVTIYLALPPAGRTSNTRRYPIAVVGGAYRGLLTSPSTRIPGLVSIADIAPTALALRAGEEPPLGSHPRTDAVRAVRDLDRRLDDASAPRDAVTISLVVTALALALAGLVLCSPLAARATPAAPLCALAVSLGLSAAGLTSPGLAVALAYGATVPLALLVVARPTVAAWLLGAFVCTYLAVLVASPQTAALAVIGPHPESGGRFFGVTNLVETLLLVGTVAVVAVAPAIPAAALALVTLLAVGWSEAGADGGGILVLGVAYAVVALLRRGARPRLPQLALAAAALLLGSLALVLLDRLTGGSSHVTRSVGEGPGSLLSDIGRRLDHSWHAATNNPHTIAICLVAIAGIVFVSTRLTRTISGTAVLAGLVVSLVVNDSPPDVLVTAAIGLAGLSIEAWSRGRRSGVMAIRPGGAAARRRRTSE